MTGQPVIRKQLPLLAHIRFARRRRIDIKVIPPTGELQTVVAHLVGKRGKFLERKVGPLAGEECDGA